MLDRFGARYYSPSIGRFINKDPIGLAGGLNMYAYVGNNPVRFMDPSGLGGFCSLQGRFHRSIGLNTSGKRFSSLLYWTTYFNNVIASAKGILVGLITASAAPPPWNIIAGASTFSGSAGLAIDAYKQAWLPINKQNTYDGPYYEDAGIYYQQGD